MVGEPFADGEAFGQPGVSPRRGRLGWSLPFLLVAVFLAGVLHLAGQHIGHDHQEHEHCRRQAVDAVQLAACECMCRREDGIWRHVFIALAPPGWRALWHRATYNECMAEAFEKATRKFGGETNLSLP